MISKKLTNITYKLARKFEENRRFNRTIKELSALNDRELSDLGISRSDIYRVARQSSETFVHG